MIAHLLRALFRRIDRHIEAHVSAALDEPEVATMHREPAPLGDAAWRAAIERACRIEAACDDFAAEVEANADAELAELLREES